MTKLSIEVPAYAARLRADAEARALIGDPLAAGLLLGAAKLLETQHELIEQLKRPEPPDGT